MCIRDRTRLQAATEVVRAIDDALREGREVLVAEAATATGRSLADEG